MVKRRSNTSEGQEIDRQRPGSVRLSMTTPLRTALERLDNSIDRLESVAGATAKKRPKGALQTGARNRTEVLRKLDGLIERVETFLSAH